MYSHKGFTLGSFVFILGLALFFIAAVAWPAPVEPWRSRLIAGGLFCVWLSTVLA